MNRVFLFLLAAASLYAPAQTPHIDLHTPAEALTPLPLSIGGRVVVQTDPTQPSFGSRLYTYQWPGIYFDTAFQGTTLYFRIASSQQHLHITVDRDQPLILSKPDPGIYRLSGLTAASHTVRLTIVSESQSSANSFGGFALPSPGSPATSTRRARQIEFIGDSYTVGYGNTAPSRQCTPDQIWSFTDTSSAFGSMVAAHFNADYQVNAISGRGIVRNYSGGPGDPLPVAYPFVLFDRKIPYSDPSWQPQVIVVSLGTNDFSTPLRPGEKWKTRDDLHADFEASYVRFLQDLHTLHPKAFLLVWATGEPNGEIETEASRVVERMKSSGETRIAFLPVDGLHMDACDFHPSAADDVTLAQRMIDLIDRAPTLWRNK